MIKLLNISVNKENKEVRHIIQLSLLKAANCLLKILTDGLNWNKI